MQFKVFQIVRSIVLVSVISGFTVQISHSHGYAGTAVSAGQSFEQLIIPPTRLVRIEPTDQERDIFTLVNRQRKIHRLHTLKWDPGLAKLARHFSKKMAREEFFDHNDPNGKSVVDRAADFRIKGWTKIGENLFFSEGFISPVGVAVESWLDSPGHRLNILDEDWTHSAIGVYESRGRKTYITQVFLQK